MTDAERMLVTFYVGLQMVEENHERDRMSDDRLAQMLDDMMLSIGVLLTVTSVEID